MKAWTNDKGQIKFQPTTQTKQLIRWNGKTPLWVRRGVIQLRGDHPYLTSAARAQRLEKRQQRKENKENRTHDWTPLCKEN